MSYSQVRNYVRFPTDAVELDAYADVGSDIVDNIIACFESEELPKDSEERARYIKETAELHVNAFLNN